MWGRPGFLAGIDPARWARLRRTGAVGPLLPAGGQPGDGGRDGSHAAAARPTRRAPDRIGGHSGVARWPVPARL